MRTESSLTTVQRLVAVDLFEQGHRHVTISSTLGVSARAVERLVSAGLAVMASTRRSPNLHASRGEHERTETSHAIPL